MTFSRDATPIPSDWESIDEMFADIRRYVGETGDRVLPADDPGYHHDPPRVARIGYVSGTGKMWTVVLNKVLDTPPTGDFSKVFQSKTPREVALRILNGDPPLPIDHDEDLERLSRGELVIEVKRLREGIRAHRDAKGHNLCWYVPELWDLLPEKVEPSPEPPPRDEFLHHCVLYRDSLDGRDVRTRDS